MPTTRARSAADVHRELEAAEQRLEALVARWRESGTTHSVPADGPTRETVERAESALRLQRGMIDHLHQLWIEYAQASGLHAPQ
jgi:hypothetical protein